MTLAIKVCQPELVEGGLKAKSRHLNGTRLRQAQADSINDRTRFIYGCVFLQLENSGTIYATLSSPGDHGRRAGSAQPHGGCCIGF